MFCVLCDVTVVGEEVKVWHTCNCTGSRTERWKSVSLWQNPG